VNTSDNDTARVISVLVSNSFCPSTGISDEEEEEEDDEEDEEEEDEEEE